MATTHKLKGTTEIEYDVGQVHKTGVEVRTGMRWVDGKPIYRMCLAVAAGPNNSEINVPHGITTIDRITSMRCELKAPTGGAGSFRLAPFEGDPTDNSGAIQMRVLDANVKLKSVADYSASSGTIVLEYTKV